MRIGTLSRLCCLILLENGPKHGYELIKQSSAQIGKTVSPGEIYPFLNRLMKEGHVRISHKGARDLKTYVLTPNGKIMVSELLKKMDLFLVDLINEKLVKCRHCECKIYGKAHKQKISGKMMNFCCKYCAGAYTNMGVNV